MHLLPALALVAAAVPLLAFSECGGDDPGTVDGPGCTAMGCHDAITYAYPQPFAGEYSLQISVDGDPSHAITAICPSEAQHGELGLRCDLDGFMLTKAPGTRWGFAYDGAVEADADAVPVDFIADPDADLNHYFEGHGQARGESYEANGPGCGPVCWDRTLVTTSFEEVWQPY